MAVYFGDFTAKGTEYTPNINGSGQYIDIFPRLVSRYEAL